MVSCAAATLIVALTVGIDIATSLGADVLRKTDAKVGHKFVTITKVAAALLYIVTMYWVITFCTLLKRRRTAKKSKEAEAILMEKLPRR